MKKIRKSTGVALAFLIYVSVTAAYLLPRNTEVSLTEKIITVAVSYVIVLLLWLVLRKKEQMRVLTDKYRFTAIVCIHENLTKICFQIRIILIQFISIIKDVLTVTP